MDPCPFVRIVVGNLGLKLPEKSHLSSLSFYCKFKLKGLPSQFSDVSLLPGENDAVDARIHCCFALSKLELERLAEKSSGGGGSGSCLKIEIRRRSGRTGGGCGIVSGGGKLLGSVAVRLDLRSVLENMGKSVIQNGWVMIGGSGVKLHLNVRAEPDPRFVFLFDGEPECSPQVFQVNGNVKQPVFTCKFSFRNSGDWNLRSRSGLSEPSTSTNCFNSIPPENEHAAKERKGWSITIHDLSGSPVAAASMVTPFVPSPGTNRVSRSNPGAWLILRPVQSTWKPWGRLEAWRDRTRGDRLGYRFDLLSDCGVDSIPLATSDISTKNGGKFNVDITTGPTPLTSPSSSFDLGSGSGSGSDLGSGSGSGSWANLLYRGFVMSSTVEGDGRCSKPKVEVGVQHVACTEDAAAFVALAAAMDLSMDACRSFSRKLRKELRQSDLE